MVDYGHYIDLPIPSGDDVLVVGEGCQYRDVVVLRPKRRPAVPKKIVAMKDATIDLCVIVMPGVNAEIPISVDIVGEGASVNLSGVYISGNEEKVIFRTDLRHRVGQSISNQMFNGIAGGKAQVGFYGRIIVAPDAQKTEAYQANHNVIISSDAKVDTKPQLEIYADDVKCSHGATIGSLNPDEQFYMRSRGITENEAKVLQMISFISPVLGHVAGSRRRSALAREIENKIREII